jgi:hypothetical protein
MARDASALPRLRDDQLLLTSRAEAYSPGSMAPRLLKKYRRSCPDSRTSREAGARGRVRGSGRLGLLGGARFDGGEQRRVGEVAVALVLWTDACPSTIPTANRSTPLLTMNEAAE